MYLVPLHKFSSRFSYIFIIAVQPATFEPLYNATFLYEILIFSRYKHILEGSVALQVGVYAILEAYVPYAFA